MTGGRGGWYLLTYGPVPGDRDSQFFDAQGMALVGSRIAMVSMVAAGQDYDYERGLASRWSRRSSGPRRSCPESVACGHDRPPPARADPGRRAGPSLDERLTRLRSKAWHIGQCAVAAALAWYIAHDVVGHARPFFAPIVAVICLGTSYGQRLRRVAEVTLGVAVGVFLADLLLLLIGTGAWQVGVLVALVDDRRPCCSTPATSS